MCNDMCSMRMVMDTCMHARVAHAHAAYTCEACLPERDLLAEGERAPAAPTAPEAQLLRLDDAGTAQSRTHLDTKRGRGRGEWAHRRTSTWRLGLTSPPSGSEAMLPCAAPRLPYAAKAQWHAKTEATLCQGAMPCEDQGHPMPRHNAMRRGRAFPGSHARQSMRSHGCVSLK